MLIFGLLKLTCKQPQCKPDFQVFQLVVRQVQKIERDFNPQLLKLINLEFDYNKILYYIDLPQQPQMDDINFQQALYDVLFNYEILEGEMYCELCGQGYKIQEGVVDYINVLQQ